MNLAEQKDGEPFEEACDTEAERQRLWQPHDHPPDGEEGCSRQVPQVDLKRVHLAVAIGHVDDLAPAVSCRHRKSTETHHDVHDDRHQRDGIPALWRNRDGGGRGVNESEKKPYEHGLRETNEYADVSHLHLPELAVGSPTACRRVCCWNGAEHGLELIREIAREAADDKPDPPELWLQLQRHKSTDESTQKTRRENLAVHDYPPLFAGWERSARILAYIVAFCQGFAKQTKTALFQAIFHS